MAASPEFVDYVGDQLRRWSPIGSRRMFGGYGVYRDGVMFGMISGDALYLRSDAETGSDFLAAGFTPFTYARRDRTVTISGLLEVPADILDDAEALAGWADKAYAVGLRKAAAAGRRRTRKPARGR